MYHTFTKWLFLCWCLSTLWVACTSDITYRTQKIAPPDAALEQKIKALYTDMKVPKAVPFALFRKTLLGFYQIPDLATDAKLVLIDFSKPSTAKRLYVFDMQHQQLLFQSLVAHGKNSGHNQATQFSNTPNSKQSSLGFYKTAETYQGKHGYSLRLDGLEQGINDNARKRSIVIHGAQYVSADFVQKNGRLGRSWGCPALPFAVSEAIIDAIKDGSVLFIYAPNQGYEQDSYYMLP